MPWCHGGDFDGIAGCHCSHEDPHLDAGTVARANWFAAEYLRALDRRRKLDAADELRPKRRARAR